MGQKSGPQLPINSAAQRSKPGFGTVVRFGRVVIEHDNILYRADKTEIGKGHTSRPNCWRVRQAPEASC
jgi:hypothetical protein